MFDAILTFLDQQQPDILLLQEVYGGSQPVDRHDLRSIEVLHQHLPQFEYYFAPELRLEREEGDYELGNAIFSRFHIIDAETVFYDIPHTSIPYNHDQRDFSQDPKNLQNVVVSIDNDNI